MDNAISNDPELERKGCAAAAEYAQIHWAKLRRLVNDDAVPAESIELHSADDRRLYACFRASISEDVAVVRAEQLKTRIWRDLLTCMDGRVKDHNFMTLLRPDAALSYDDQRDSLFVVPRAQFLMIELARQREGCYDGAWRAKRRACAMPASAPLRLARTARYSVLECAAALRATSAARTLGVDASSPADARTMSTTAEGAEAESDNARAARLGKQLAECVPCAEAARRLPWPRTAARKPRDGAPVVVDGALDQAACAEACAAALAFFDGAGDRRIAEQALHRGDDVAFVPLFGEDLCGNQI